MVTRYTTKGDGAAVQDPGRQNSERAIERGKNKKFMDSIMEDSDGAVDALIKKLQLTTENAVKRSYESNGKELNAIEGAMAVMDLKKEILKGYKDGLVRNMSAHQMTLRMAAERKEAGEYLTGEKEKALNVRKGTTTTGKARAESSALEMAKGTLKQ